MVRQLAPNIAYSGFQGLGLVILCHGKRNPTDLEWATYVELLGEAFKRNAGTRVLVVTEGGHPSREQQARMNAVLGGAGARVSVISASLVARFVTSVLVMTNPDIRCFAPDEINKAYDHLGLAEDQRPQVNQSVRQLQRTLRAT